MTIVDGFYQNQLKYDYPSPAVRSLPENVLLFLYMFFQLIFGSLFLSRSLPETDYEINPPQQPAAVAASAVGITAAVSIWWARQNGQDRYGYRPF